MTLWALLSDVHGRGDRLARVLDDIQLQHASHPEGARPAGAHPSGAHLSGAHLSGGVRILALGDIASPAALSRLDRVGALCVFGNWEASGLRGLPPPYRSWVGRWPAVLQVDGFLAAHATPVWPANLSISGVVEFLRANNLHWTQLFPSLQYSESSRTAAFAALTETGYSIFFHGHTHVQEAWRQAEGDSPRRIEYASVEGGVLQLGEGERWLIGVGSVGDPHDGPGAHYALYDSVARRFTWHRV